MKIKKLSDCSFTEAVGLVRNGIRTVGGKKLSGMVVQR